MQKKFLAMLGSLVLFGMYTVFDYWTDPHLGEGMPGRPKCRQPLAYELINFNQVENLFPKKVEHFVPVRICSASLLWMKVTAQVNTSFYGLYTTSWPGYLFIWDQLPNGERKEATKVHEYVHYLQHMEDLQSGKIESAEEREEEAYSLEEKWVISQFKGHFNAK